MPAPAVTAAAPPAVPTGGGGGPGRVKCTLCTRLGIGRDNHKREWCYIDPASRVFKPDILAQRIAMAQARGITVPQDILDLQKVPAAGRLNWVACMTQVMATAAPYDE